MVSRWLLWLATRTAGPSRGSRSRWRTFKPSPRSTTGRTTSQKKRKRGSRLKLVSLASQAGDHGAVQVPDEVVEEQRRVGEAVDAVEDAAVAWHEAAAVLDPPVALQGRGDDVAHEAAEADQQPGDDRLEPGEGGEEGGEQHGEGKGRGDAAQEPLHGLPGAHLGDRLVAAERLAPQVLRDVVELGEEDQVEDEAGAAAPRVDGGGQHQQEGHVADAEDGRHHPPVEGAGGAQAGAP